MKLNNTFAWGANTTKIADKKYAYNTEYKTDEIVDGKPVYIFIAKQGDIKTRTAIASSGTFIDRSIDTFLGIAWGAIRRNTDDNQIHNINAVSNLPDQHASIIYQTGNRLQWYYNQSMTLSNFKNMPFIACLKYTKLV